MTRNELTDHIGYVERELIFYKQLKPNCTTCDNLRDSVCRKYQAAPPDDFINHGCDAWDFDDVPF